MEIILIAGLWLRKSIWNDVADELNRLGHTPLPIGLPGVDDGATAATLDDQVAAVTAAIDTANQPIVVGHSAACSLAWLAADRRPDQVGRVALIGGFPASDGETYADFFPLQEGQMGFPGWDPFEGADSADLDEAARQAIAGDAVPVPGGVAQGVVRLSDERRFDVRTVVVCPEFTPAQARGWIDGGDAPELARVNNVELVDIDSGHWPMVTKPVELASILDAATTTP